MNIFSSFPIPRTRMLTLSRLERPRKKPTPQVLAESAKAKQDPPRARVGSRRVFVSAISHRVPLYGRAGDGQEALHGALLAASVWFRGADIWA